jgi:hypothetical protein
MRAGGYMIPVKMWIEEDRIFFQFGFNRSLMNAIKALENPKWHGFEAKNPRKLWSVKASYRNLWWLKSLQGGNPFERYDAPIIEHKPTRDGLYDHQVQMFQHGATYQSVVWGAEMGVGKSLALIELMEFAARTKDFQDHEFLVVGTKASLKAVRLELQKWKCDVQPVLMTYDRLRIKIKNESGDIAIPKFVAFDECSKLKTANSLRSQAALWLTNCMRDNWMDDMFVVGMTGTPAPKNPADWWHIAEVHCPGFLREANSGALQRRLSWVETEMTMQGQAFPKIKSWKDSEEKCGFVWEEELGEEDDGKPAMVERYCTETADHVVHSEEALVYGEEHPHEFVKSVDEVSKLYRRLKGLVQIHFKKDCLDLPDKIEAYMYYANGEWHQALTIDDAKPVPARSVVRAAKHIMKTAPRVVTALTNLRELSDGFQYAEEGTGEYKDCKACDATGEEVGLDEDGDEVVGKCVVCKGVTKVETKIRTTVETKNPKVDLLRERLDLHEDNGRYVVCCAFQGSMDIVRNVCNAAGWTVIQADGRGWKVYNKSGVQLPGISHEDMLRLFAGDIEGPEKLAFVGHPGTMGMGLNLQASCELLWYSMPFNAEEFIQATDRIYRPGMNIVKGCTIVYAFHLGTDLVVYANLMQKKELQALSMGAVKEATDV